MKLNSLLVVGALLALALPVHADSASDVTERNEAWFRALLEGSVGHQDADVVIDWDAPEAASARDAVRLLAARAGERDLTAALEGGEETGDFPVLGDIWLIENAIGFGEPPAECSQGGGGTGGHYEVAVDDPGVGPYPYTGAAVSTISTAGNGVAIEWTSGKVVAYSEEIVYAGNSDFWCIEFDFFGIFFVLNFPFLLGAAQGLQP